MITIDKPPQIRFELPYQYSTNGTKPVPLVTRLFRESHQAPELLEAIYGRVPEDSDISITSLGCSSGLELIGTVALHENSGQGGVVRGRGLDISPDAIHAAESGVYDLSERHHGTPGRRNWVGTTLREYGFTTTFNDGYEGFEERQRLGRGHDQYRVDSRPVRQRHDIAFELFDMTDARATAPNQADVVMINNVLYHLQPEPATVALQIAAAMVEKGGVLGIGAIGNFRMGGQHTRTELHYGEWLELKIDELVQDSGFSVVRAPDAFNKSVILERAA